MADNGSGGVVCRLIEERDIPAVLDCLTRGFPERRRDYWARGLERLARLPRVDDHPQYGRLLEANGAVVGVMLQLFSARDGAQTPRCNLSSWFVDPDYRSYAHALHARAIARREIVYLNISAAPHTVPALTALGYRRYTEGQFLFAPLLSRGAAKARVVAFAEDAAEAQALSPNDRRLLADHAAFGCVALIGVKDGAATPLVFEKRTIWRERSRACMSSTAATRATLRPSPARSAAFSRGAAASSACSTPMVPFPGSQAVSLRDASRVTSRAPRARRRRPPSISPTPNSSCSADRESCEVASVAQNC